MNETMWVLDVQFERDECVVGPFVSPEAAAQCLDKLRGVVGHEIKQVSRVEDLRDDLRA